MQLTDALIEDTWLSYSLGEPNRNNEITKEEFHIEIT